MKRTLLIFLPYLLTSFFALSQSNSLRVPKEIDPNVTHYKKSFTATDGKRYTMYYTDQLKDRRTNKDQKYVHAIYFLPEDFTNYVQALGKYEDITPPMMIEFLYHNIGKDAEFVGAVVRGQEIVYGEGEIHNSNDDEMDLLVMESLGEGLSKEKEKKLKKLEAEGVKVQYTKKMYKYEIPLPVEIANEIIDLVAEDTNFKPDNLFAKMFKEVTTPEIIKKTYLQ